MDALAFWQFIGFFLFGCCLLLLGLVFYEPICKLWYGDRRKRAFFVDIRKHKYITLDKTRKTFKYMDLDHTWNNDLEYNGCAFYITTQVDPLKAGVDSDKWLYYCDTNEFMPVFRNKIIETLMLFKERNMIILAVILSGICVVVAVWIYLKVGDLQNTLTNMQAQLTAIQNQATVNAGAAVNHAANGASDTVIVNR